MLAFVDTDPVDQLTWGLQALSVLAAQILIQGATDHGVSESIYLSDPDGNGIELTCDRPQSE